MEFHSRQKHEDRHRGAAGPVRRRARLVGPAATRFQFLAAAFMTAAMALLSAAPVSAQAGCSGSTAVGGSTVTSGGLVDDCEALLASESTLVGTGTALNWDTGTAMTSWTGVTLASGRVGRLVLHQHVLGGTIPAALDDLIQPAP